MKRILLLIGLICLIATPTFAASKIYTAPEASITWTDTGGDELLDIGGQAADAIDMGAFSDLGANSHASSFNIEVTIDGFDAPPVVGEDVRVYLSFSNATTNFDGNPTTDPTTSAEGTITVAQAENNCFFVGSLIVYSTTAGDELKATFQNIFISSRYVSVIVHNNTADALLSTSDAHKVILVPSPLETQ